MIMSVECVPELKIDLDLDLDGGYQGVGTLVVITTCARVSCGTLSQGVCGKPTDIFAFHKAIFDGTTNTLTGFLFVTVVASTVEETVTDFDSIINNLRAHINERSRAIVSIRLTSAQLAFGICNGKSERGGWGQSTLAITYLP